MTWTRFERLDGKLAVSVSEPRENDLYWTGKVRTLSGRWLRVERLLSAEDEWTALRAAIRAVGMEYGPFNRGDWKTV